jgi:hypothetical protein
MNWWNLGGLNPNFKDFMEKHPDKTMIGTCWSLFWRLWLILFVFEIAVMLLLVVLGVGFSFIHQ